MEKSVFNFDPENTPYISVGFNPFHHKFCLRAPVVITFELVKKIVIIVKSHFSLQEYLKSCTSCTSLKNQLLYKFLTSALISTLGHDDNMTKWRILLEFV